ncbi:MAG: aldose 1-epimerase family protein [Alphaproteobacteria bacterium]
MPKLFGRDWSRAQLVRQFGDMSQVFGVRAVTCDDGPERGLRVLEFDTGCGFRFDVLVDRCMDIGSMQLDRAAIGWHSPTGFRHPWLHEVDAEGGLGFLRSFSGFMNTCGLDHVLGMAEESADHYNYPYRAKIFHGIHGRASYTPARLVGYGVQWDGDQCTLWAEGEVRQAAMFAENLKLTRRIEARVGEPTVSIRDRVENLGFYRTPHMLLYHVNIGWPVLDDGSELVAPIAGTPFMAHDPDATDVDYRFQTAPLDGFREQVYAHEVKTAADGTALAALVNRRFDWGDGRTGLGFQMEYDKRALPCLLQWQNLQAGNYVMGIEPCTVWPGSRQQQRERGEIRWLDHGQESSYALRFSALAGEAALASLDARVAAIQG